MAQELFCELDRILESRDVQASLDYVIEELKASEAHNLVFEARLMKKRFELGLPLVQTEASNTFPEPARSAYEQAMVEAAREAGNAYLESGQLERAWPYFRAIGETEAMAAAIDTFSPDAENIDAVINIALQEGVNAARGIELVLKRHGMCRAITCFGMYPIQKDRERCLALLIGSLHRDLLARIADAIESVEGSRPSASTAAEMIAGRDWLFGEYDYYVDTSHLLSLLQYCPETTRTETLHLLRDLCAYGRCLSHNFQSRGRVPFADPFVDYDHYAQALLGIDRDQQIAYFEKELEALDPEEASDGPAQVLVNFLARLGRYDNALAISLKYLANAVSDLPCPSAAQLCFLAKDYEQLKELSRERGDVLTYLAASTAAAQDQSDIRRLRGKLYGEGDLQVMRTDQ